MYKVFFNDRMIILSDQPETSGEGYPQNHAYRNLKELKKAVFSFLSLNSVQALLIHHKDIEVLFKDFLSLFDFVEAAGGLVRNTDSDILVILRRGIWDLPKGKLDSGESMEEAALREVTEECGIHGQTITRPLPPTYHIYLEKKIWHLKKTHWFEMSYRGQEVPVPQQSEQITDVRWISKANLLNITDEAFRSLLEIFRFA